MWKAPPAGLSLSTRFSPLCHPELYFIHRKFSLTFSTIHADSDGGFLVRKVDTAAAVYIRNVDQDW